MKNEKIYFWTWLLYSEKGNYYKLLWLLTFRNNSLYLSNWKIIMIIWVYSSIFPSLSNILATFITINLCFPRIPSIYNYNKQLNFCKSKMINNIINWKLHRLFEGFLWSSSSPSSNKLKVDSDGVSLKNENEKRKWLFPYGELFLMKYYN